jgi:hypothetical protein
MSNDAKPPMVKPPQFVFLCFTCAMRYEGAKDHGFRCICGEELALIRPLT